MSATPPKSGAIFPTRAAPLASLTVTMAVMCYLACIAIAALILINRAVDEWTHGLSREVTVQLRQISNVDIEEQVAMSQRILTATPGILKVETLDKAAGLKLLEPWLGKLAEDDLPIPRLIRVSIDEDRPPNFPALEQALNKDVKGVSLDTHKRWEGELTRTATSLSHVAYGILILIGLASVMLVIFAARAVLVANQSVVETLELIGAKNSYIARLSDWQFLKSGLLAGFAGLLAAVLTFYLLSKSGNAAGDAIAQAGDALLFSPVTLNLNFLLAMITVPFAATFIAVLTSRLTLAHMLRASK